MKVTATTTVIIRLEEDEKFSFSSDTGEGVCEIIKFQVGSVRRGQNVLIRGAGISKTTGKPLSIKRERYMRVDELPNPIAAGVRETVEAYS